MATVHKAYKGAKGKPVKKATGKQIGTTGGAMPSTTYHENSRRRMNQAREIARKARRSSGH